MCIDNLEVLFEASDLSDAQVCFMAARNLTDLINTSEINGTTSTPDPVVSFLTAGSSLEQQETEIRDTGTNPEDSGVSQNLPPILLLLSTIIAVLFAYMWQ